MLNLSTKISERLNEPVLCKNSISNVIHQIQKKSRLLIVMFCSSRKLVIAFFCQLLKLLQSTIGSYYKITCHSVILLANMHWLHKQSTVNGWSIKPIITYLWSRWARISPPGKADCVASNATLIACFQVPPISFAFVSALDWLGSSIGKE